jgi:HD-GYP domain-containing protein (c-di-GMP phosphodiesterase class II)
MDLVKNHPQGSYDILKNTGLPWPVVQIVFQHHERMDGSGYPQGLSGREILMEARILAVADVVGSMTSHRPYRRAHSIEKALEEISQNRGVLYDPEVVDACSKVITEKGFKF